MKVEPSPIAAFTPLLITPNNYIIKENKLMKNKERNRRKWDK
jgi:hypothetical protein